MTATMRAWLTIVCLSLLATGCADDGVRPEDLDVTGVWLMSIGRAPSEFEFDLREEPGGLVTGTWSFPSQFANHAVEGRRIGERLMLRADSPNSYPVTLDVHFIRRGVLEGSFYFGTTIYDVTLGRR